MHSGRPRFSIRIEAGTASACPGEVAPILPFLTQQWARVQARFFCNAMPWVDCTQLRYHCTKLPDVDLCPQASQSSAPLTTTLRCCQWSRFCVCFRLIEPLYIACS